jgi:diguanylate cyclase
VRALFAEQHKPYDRLFRYGGEEFLLCAPNTDVKAARSLVERLRKGLAALVFEDSDRTAFHITVSFGLSLLDPQLPVEQSIDHADKALYSAKSAGRNRTVIWDRTMV